MNSEELLKNYKKIENDFIINPPEIWVKFAVSKKQVDSSLLPVSMKKATRISMYLNIVNGKVQFEPNGNAYVELSKCYNDDFTFAQLSETKDYITISCWRVCDVDGICSETFSDEDSFNTRYIAEYKACLIINSNKDIILQPHEEYLPITPHESLSKEPIICRWNDNQVYFGLYNWDIISAKTINIKKCFIEVFGIGLVGGNKYTIFDNISTYTKFLGYKEPVMRDTPKQRLINSLVEIELAVPAITFDSSLKSKLVCVASKVNEEYSTLRWFMETSEKKPYEISRLYVSKKEHIFCRKNSNGQYLVLNNKLSSEAFDSQTVIIQDDAFAGTKLEYFKEIYNEVKPELRGAVLYMLTTYPDFEKMYKVGLKKTCIGYLTQPNGTQWNDYLIYEFGQINTKEKTINKMLGFNIYQLNLIDKYRPEDIEHYCLYGLGFMMKMVFNNSDCASVDNESFEAILEMFIEKKDVAVAKALAETINTYSIKVCINMLHTIKKFHSVVKNVTCNTIYESFPVKLYAINLYTDYVVMVRQLGEAARLRPQFDSFEEILRMHDDVTEVLNAKEDDITAKNFNNRISVWKKWEFNDDEKYEVIAPTKPEDIVNEGISLRHCVKSYICSVATGITNILFIREKDKRDIPFFTVEIGNKNTIEQIHGFGNRNVNTEPGLEDFVKKWAKERNLKASSYNKIR